MPTQSIQYIKRTDIDIERWDEVIKESHNGLIYAYSYYLDAMAENWDALVLNDFEAVMPLTWKKKWGIKYLYQPAFTQQLGIFSKEVLQENVLKAFTNEAQKQFLFAEIYINFQYGTNAVSCKNFVLPLQKSYPEISSGYKQDLVRNIKRSNNFQLQYNNTLSYKKIIEHYIQAYSKKLPYILKKDFERWSLLCAQLQQKNQLVTRTVTDEKFNVLSMLLCCKDEHQIYLLMSVTLDEGRKKEANHFLIDRLIKEFSDQNLVLDFEGSDIEGIANFYQNFGSKNEPYYFLRWNHLPFFIKWLKK